MDSGEKEGHSPGTGQEAGDALDVHLPEVAEVQLGQIQVSHGLQDLHGCRTLERQQGAVIMLDHLHTALLHQAPCCHTPGCCSTLACALLTTLGVHLMGYHDASQSSHVSNANCVAAGSRPGADRSPGLGGRPCPPQQPLGSARMQCLK